MVCFTKHNDTWALRSDVPLPIPGMEVKVTKRDGSSQTAKVGDLLARIDGRFPGYIYAIQAAPRAATPAPAAVGNLDGILKLFAQAKAHLKYPKVVLTVGEGAFAFAIRISLAGDRAKVPGSLNVTSADFNGTHNDFGAPQRDWFGRVLTDGTFEPSRQAQAVGVDQITAVLQRFAAEPAKVASEYGRLHGVCCFCGLALSDERSTAVGYGKICAAHYSLPWGEVEHSFTCDEGRAA